MGLETAAVVRSDVGVGLELQGLLRTVNCEGFSQFVAFVVDDGGHVLVLLP